MRAAEAAKNTSSLIENTIKAVKNGNDLTEQPQEAFQENITIAGKIGQLIDEIATASNEQARGISQINTAVAEIDKVTQRNAANAEESASAAEEMSAQAENMKSHVRDLVALVGGGVNGHGGTAGTMSPVSARATGASVPSGKFRSLVAHIGPGPGAKKARLRNETSLGPEAVIPTNTDDFRDF